MRCARHLPRAASHAMRPVSVMSPLCPKHAWSLYRRVRPATSSVCTSAGRSNRSRCGTLQGRIFTFVCMSPRSRSGAACRSSSAIIRARTAGSSASRTPSSSGPSSNSMPPQSCRCRVNAGAAAASPPPPPPPMCCPSGRRIGTAVASCPDSSAATIASCAVLYRMHWLVPERSGMYSGYLARRECNVQRALTSRKVRWVLPLSNPGERRPGSRW